MPPSISRAGAGACTTMPVHDRQASFGRLVTITRNCAGITSRRSEVSSPIIVMLARQHGHAVSSGASVTSIRGRCAGSAPRLARRLAALLRRIALLRLCVFLGDRLLESFQAQLQLFLRQTLRAGAKLQAP